jgi:predicted Fe-Mo cluster-binding NifX family protein
MKTIISSTGNNAASPFDLRFGRAGWFCLLDEETGQTSYFKNEYQDTGHGAGIRAAEKAIELGATKVISGDFGPKAKELLDKFNIQMVILTDDTHTIHDIVHKIRN